MSDPEMIVLTVVLVVGFIIFLLFGKAEGGGGELY